MQRNPMIFALACDCYTSFYARKIRPVRIVLGEQSITSNGLYVQSTYT